MTDGVRAAKPDRTRERMMLHVVLLVGITGMIYIYPFGGNLRFSLSVTILSTMLLYFRHLSPVATAAFSGLAVFLLRSAVLGPANFPEMLTTAPLVFPAVYYYISFGILFVILRIRRNTDNIPALILLLTLADMVSNCVEMLIRNEPTGRRPEEIFIGLASVALFRAVLTCYLYYALQRYRNFVLAEEKISRYAEMTVLIAKLKAELFYLQKSSQDIERVMEKGYSLYQDLYGGRQDELARPESPAARALAVAREIHEIKKDYYRVTHGIENILVPSEEEAGRPGMSFHHIFQIIEQNTGRYLAGLGKAVHIVFEESGDLRTVHQYTVVSILDNIITNAIEAVQDNGVILISQKIEGDIVVLRIRDNGCGIQPDERGLIFLPGYSTKFSETTGQMSTGLGLAHVKNLTESLGGTISVNSRAGEYTAFEIRIPRYCLEAGAAQNSGEFSRDAVKEEGPR